jgi:hypothetical protein
MSKALNNALVGLIIVICCAIVAAVPAALLPLGALAIGYGCWRGCKWLAWRARENQQVRAQGKTNWTAVTVCVLIAVGLISYAAWHVRQIAGLFDLVVSAVLVAAFSGLWIQGADKRAQRRAERRRLEAIEWQRVKDSPLRLAFAIALFTSPITLWILAWAVGLPW